MKKFDLNSIVRENVKSLKPYSSARDEFKDFKTDLVFLDANENPFENGVNRYPDPQQRDLKAVWAELRDIDSRQILMGNGSDEVLDLIFRAFCEPNRDNVISLPPTYGMYKVLAATNAIENREVLLNTDFQPKVEDILAKVDSFTKLMFLCSPNNPTGNLIEASRIEKLLRGFNGLVVVDEAYIDFAHSDSWVKRLGEFPNLIVTQTLSKAYGMAGIRLGICMASTDIISVLNKIKPPYNVNQLTQRRALEGLQALQKDTQVSDILNERKRLVDGLRAIPFVTTIFPSDANFVLVRVDDADLRYEQLVQEGIVIRNRSTQPLCEDTLRFTVGTKEENQALLTALKKLSDA